MKTPSYCMYNDVNCSECSLVSYGYDCKNLKVGDGLILEGMKEIELSDNDKNSLCHFIGKSIEVFNDVNEGQRELSGLTQGGYSLQLSENVKEVLQLILDNQE